LSPLWVDRVAGSDRRHQPRRNHGFSWSSKNASLALEIAHHAYVLQTGRIILDGPARRPAFGPRASAMAYLGGQEGSRLAPRAGNLREIS